jgi:hypothetical protein
MKKFDPEFKPELTPKEMLELGIFGGIYFHGGGEKEFPKSWFKNAKISKDGTYQKELNFFKIKASQSLQEWQKKGWISKHDPRGWFEWYCRYYLGRRIPDEDARQIARWKNMTRHVTQITKNCRAGDFQCRTRQRQAVLHWAYDSCRL